ncbi:MAG: hypothetical protein NT067_04100, partial [Candidatus Diapherotrites archaeon]|nr:hypothetical protein [Candidatus Diapherotrites archaeon]
ALAETLFPLELEKNNPLFNLKFESPGPGTESLKAGQKVQVSASFESSAGAQDAKIWVFLPETKEKEELSEQEGIFSGEITLPGSGQEKARLILYGTAKAGGAEVGDIEEAEFSLSSELIVSFVYPAAGAIQQQGDGKTLTVSVSLPNGDPPTKNSFRGSLDIDGKKQDVLLTRGAEKNQYALKLESALSGKHSLKLALSNVDGLKGYAEVSTEISQAFDWIGLLLLVLVVGALAYFANFIRLKFRAGAQGTAKAEVQPEKKDFLKEEKKRLEIEFYKRRISEEEFKERMLELQKGEKSRAIPREGKEINEIVIEPQKREGQAKPRIPLFFGRPKAAPKPEEDHARQVIEKRLESEDALSPLIIGRESDKAKTSAPQKPAQQGIVVEEFRPAAAKEAQAQKEPEFPKPKETLSAKKREDVREKIDMLARQGALQQKDEEAVNELVFALKPKAFAYTRNEIFESVIGEGFSERIAAEVVKRIFG